MANSEPGDGIDTFDTLHAWLTVELGLVPEAAHGGSWRSYFLGAVDWHPGRSTRLLKVLLDHAGAPFKVQLCVSSDNNNSVFIDAPFDLGMLRVAIDAEAALLAKRAHHPVVPAEAGI